MKEHQTLRAVLKSTELPLVLATLCKKVGSSYRGIGARLVSDGTRILSGSISGGCIEADLVLKAKDLLKTRQSQLISYDLTSEAEDPFGYGMGCDGTISVLLQDSFQFEPYCQAIDLACKNRQEVYLTTNLTEGSNLGEQKIFYKKPDEDSEILLEQFTPPISLVLFGGGRDAEPFIGVASILGWHVYLCDYRKGHLPEDLRSPCVTAIHGSPQQIIQQVPFDKSTAFVAMTHQLGMDIEMVSEVMKTESFYIGLMGHRQRLRDLSLTGLKQDARLYSPIGLDLGAREPSQIALSLCSEILAIYNGTKGSSLSAISKINL